MNFAKTIVLVVLLGACGGPPVAESGSLTNSALADSPAALAYPQIPAGNTRLAAIAENWFSDNPTGADLRIQSFDCNSIRATYGEKLVLCGSGGLTESPFMVAVVEEYVSEVEDAVSTSLSFLMYEPVIDSSGKVSRATVVASGTRTYETASFDSTEFQLLGATTVQGKVLALHARVFGGSRTWNEIAMLGLNQFGSAQVVATFDGEGVAVFQDGDGFVLSNYHYGHDDAMCCASYWAVNYFHPGPEGWTHTKQTIESDPNKDLDEEQPFIGFQEPLLIGTYELPRPEFEQ